MSSLINHNDTPIEATTSTNVASMKSSYKNNLDYKDIFDTSCFLKNPQKIVEIGILDGYSLKALADNVSSSCQIDAYDIFEEFNGNGANKERLTQTFRAYKNVNIQYGDFYKVIDNLCDESIDILHIDVANTGEVFEIALTNYIKKIKKDGIIILEGGSKERDEVEWMNKYDKPKITPILNKYKDDLKIKIIGILPSLTIIRK
jgi:predicted O-methyltransferase YrrM